MGLPLFERLIAYVTKPKVAQINPIYDEIEKMAAGALVADYAFAETLSGTRALTDDDNPILALTPSGADRTVTLPATAATNHAQVLYNAGTSAAYSLLVQDSGGATTYLRLAPGQMATFLSDGSVWMALPGIQLQSVPDGTLLNGKFVVSVAANNLTLAVKTSGGENPSTGNPVWVKINGLWRSITASLSVTAAAATNHCGAGSAETAAKAIDFFPYLGWRAASSAVVVGFSRMPFARLYSDFNATATDPKGSVWSTAPASSDDVAVIGRFEATLSGGAGYTWTVPTWTSANLIPHTIYKTRQLTWTPTPTGWSTPTVVDGVYQVDFDRFDVDTFSVTGTSTTTTVSITLPFAAVGTARGNARGVDNGTPLTTPALALVSSSANMDGYTTWGGAGWTASGTKTFQQATLRMRLR